MLIVILLTLMAVVAGKTEGDYYNEKYENFNVKDIVENIRMLKSFVLCIRRKGKCTPEGHDFKRWVPEAVHSKCGKCTEKHKPLVAIVIKAIIEKLPNDWQELLQEHDPKRERTDELNEFMQQYLPKER